MSINFFLFTQVLVEIYINIAKHGTMLHKIWVLSDQRMPLTVTSCSKSEATYPLATIISEKSFENVCNLLRTSLTSIAIDISVLIDRETQFSKVPIFVTVGSPWRIKSLELDDMASRCPMT